MAAFRFRLASVLRFRERARSERQWELGTLERENRSLASEIRRLEQLLDLQVRKLGEGQGGLLSLADVAFHADFSRRVVERIREMRARLADMQKVLAEKRQEVVEADREVKVLERLRERLRERHREQEERKEQDRLDEMGLRRHLGSK